MKIYLAGPMTGIKDLNFPRFHGEAARLRALGHQVINPAELNADTTALFVEYGLERPAVNGAAGQEGGSA